MNERIKQMAEQSGMYKILDDHAGEFGYGTFENTPYPELESFAALAAERKPLTDEQIDKIILRLMDTTGANLRNVARAIEQAHGIGEQE